MAGKPPPQKKLNDLRFNGPDATQNSKDANGVILLRSLVFPSITAAANESIFRFFFCKDEKKKKEKAASGAVPRPTKEEMQVVKRKFDNRNILGNADMN